MNQIKNTLAIAAIALGIAAAPALAQDYGVTQEYGLETMESEPMPEPVGEPMSRVLSVDLTGTTFGYGEVVAAADGDEMLTETYAVKDSELLLEGEIDAALCGTCTDVQARALGSERIQTGGFAIARGTGYAASGIADHQAAGVSIDAELNIGSPMPEGE